jgi:hypothetical protein
VEREDRYRFYWAIYVRSVDRITVPYMRLLSRGTGSLVLGPLRPKYLSRVPVFSLRRALVTERMTRGGAPGPATWPQADRNSPREARVPKVGLLGEQG